MNENIFMQHTFDMVIYKQEESYKIKELLMVSQTSVFHKCMCMMGVMIR